MSFFDWLLANGRPEKLAKTYSKLAGKGNPTVDKLHGMFERGEVPPAPRVRAEWEVPARRGKFDLEAALKDGVVVEVWHSDDRYTCLASLGKDPQAYRGSARTWQEAAAEAVDNLRLNVAENAAKEGPKGAA